MQTIERGMNLEDMSVFPLFLRGTVINGFGRGSKQLGCPTANLPVEQYEETIKDIPVGVFYGWAKVTGVDTEVHKMVMSIGWNPFYKNEKKTIEIHILKRYDEDFYSKEISAIATGFIRPMCDFNDLPGLIQAIQDDISFAGNQLESSEQQQTYRSHNFFVGCISPAPEQTFHNQNGESLSHSVVSLK
ncbi:hypothetical protein SAMD00019534_124810, partial [Acytostelium subglobosum LB1]|uniref:hypothetical protein n=1 Tax=Acytostelium subglobosum LB1 TaxID=1410327 RepID=UPI0006448202